MMRRSFVVMALTVTMVLAGCTSVGTPVRDASASASEPIPTMVVLDASESMQVSDAPGPRWTAATRAVDALVGGLPSGTDFGIVLFGADFPAKSTPSERGCLDVRTPVPLSPVDAAVVTSALAGVTPQGFTPIGTALQSAADQLPTTGPSSIVLVSDGESTCPPDPCDVARQIRGANPMTTVSAIGFRTDAESLKCIARDGGGVFLTADNAEQLSARLAAVQDTKVARSRLSPTSYGPLSVGQSLDDVRAAEPSFPSDGEQDGDRLVIVWRDCTYVFDEDRILVEIAPGDPAGSAGVTIDGVAKGTAGSRAVELYGQPLSDDGGTAVFTADEGAGVGYRMGYSGGGSIAQGTVETVVLCRCLPEAAKPAVEPVLGRDGFGTTATGFGTAKPTGFSIASTASSSVNSITWLSWGGAEAIGRGKSQQNGPGEPQSTTWLLASDVGWCDGTWAYRGLQRAGDRAELRSNEEVRDICVADRNAPRTPSSDEVTLSPTSLLTFGGVGGVYVGDPASKIPNTYRKREEVGQGRYPPGTVLYYFGATSGQEMYSAFIEVAPNGLVKEIRWFATDRGIRLGSTGADVDRAYAGVTRGTCRTSSGGVASVFVQDGRPLVLIELNGVVAFLVVPARGVTDGGDCGFE